MQDVASEKPGREGHHDANTLYGAKTNSGLLTCEKELVAQSVLDQIGTNGLHCSYALEDYAMSTNAVVRARIDEGIKEEATLVLEAMGLTTSDAIRIMLTRVAREGALPFEMLVPNETTIKAMREARRGNLEVVTLDELQAVIDADD